MTNIDVLIGARIKGRRIALKISQTKLAKPLVSASSRFKNMNQVPIASARRVCLWSQKR